MACRHHQLSGTTNYAVSAFATSRLLDADAGVRPAVAVGLVLAVAAVDGVVTGAAAETVVTTGAVDGVVARAAAHVPVRSVGARDPVVARATDRGGPVAETTGVECVVATL